MFKKYTEARETVDAVQFLEVGQLPEILKEFGNPTFMFNGTIEKFTLDMNRGSYILKRGDYLVRRFHPTTLQDSYEILSHKDFHEKWQNV